MALRLSDLRIAVGDDETSLKAHAASFLDIEEQDLANLRIVRRALDARRKSRPVWVYTIEFDVADQGRLLKAHPEHKLQEVVPPPEILLPRVPAGRKALVVGMGPSGLFAAKRLAEAGLQVTLIERGRPVEDRVRAVERFWRESDLDPENNVQFGEGGAGTFSDGKLTTRLNHPWRQHVLETLVRFGAQPELLVDAKPHVGTDRLRQVVINFRKYLTAIGVALRFGTRLSGLVDHDGGLAAGILDESEQLECDALVLAIGHSARDTYEMLARHGVSLEPKGFAIGARVEHPAGLIDRIQYGRGAPGGLPTADYALRYNDPESGRGIYSFCMCPGGEVINAASESGGLVVNGMSRATRAGHWSNSALVVSVSPQDWDGTALGGVAFQRRWERRAFEVGGGGYRAPAQNLLAFAGQGTGPVVSTCRPEVVEAELDTVLPDYVTRSLRKALPQFDRQMRGFLSRDAVLIGVETRTSAPLRITRDESGQSVSLPGLYPAGEGAGYAGGIMSAAFDGLKAAERVLQQITQGSPD